jgi:CO/xanthine dehydrogenase Mo-binding subunit
MAHAFSRWGWSRASFPIAGQTWIADIDALAVRNGSGTYTCLDRSNVKYPPTANNRSGPVYTAGCASVVRIEIERSTGLLRVEKAYSVLECGQALVPDIVVGQAQGGFAMGVGYALLESLPLYEGGPGNGTWNLGQYVIARASDLPQNGVEIEVLPPLAPTEPPKGIAEVVMIPIVPAILNAIHDATGHRFRTLPVTQAMIKGALA